MYNCDTLICRFLCSIGAPSRLWWEGIRPFFGIFDLKFVFLIEFHFGYHLDRSSGTMVWVQKNGVTRDIRLHDLFFFGTKLTRKKKSLCLGRIYLDSIFLVGRNLVKRCQYSHVFSARFRFSSHLFRFIRTVPAF